MKKKFLVFGLLFPILLSIAGSTLPASAAKADSFKGTITVSGAWALYPMMVRWGEEFQKIHPQVRLDISAGGAGKGMADALAGIADIGMVSRDIAPEEIAKGAFAIAVTKDAVFPAINAKNPLAKELMGRGISQALFKDIYITGKIKTWEQVIGKPQLPQELHVYTRSDAAGAPEVWANYLGKKQEDLLGIGVYGDPGILDAVIKDPLGLGYNNLNYVYDAKTGLPVAGALVVPIDINNNGKADPDEILDTKIKAVQAVASGKYPSPPARALFLVTKGKPTGLVKEFVLWILTDGQKYQDEVGYIPLDQSLLGDYRRKVN
jgi:phosphate transport system substrate-binding protein